MQTPEEALEAEWFALYDDDAYYLNIELIEVEVEEPGKEYTYKGILIVPFIEQFPLTTALLARWENEKYKQKR